MRTAFTSAIAGAFAAAALLATPASANTFGGYYLEEPCCGSDPLYGTRASITTPISSADLQFVHLGCVAYRSGAEAPDRPYADGNHIQVGWLKCSQYADVQGTCGVNQRFEYYTEIFDGLTGDFLCYPRGAAVYNTVNLFSVTTTSNPRGRWLSYINGQTDFNSIQMGASLLYETAEWTGSFSAQFTARAQFATLDRWQRLNATSWVNVQSAYMSRDDAWQIDGGPPNAWTVRH